MQSINSISYFSDNSHLDDTSMFARVVMDSDPERIQETFGLQADLSGPISWKKLAQMTFSFKNIYAEMDVFAKKPYPNIGTETLEMSEDPMPYETMVEQTREFHTQHDKAKHSRRVTPMFYTPSQERLARYASQ